MLLKAWMRDEGLTDREMADCIGDISLFMVRKLRFRERGPSVRVAARIEELSGGQVRARDLEPAKPRRSPAEASS
jgi:hypothetical protein